MHSLKDQTNTQSITGLEDKYLQHIKDLNQARENAENTWLSVIQIRFVFLHYQGWSIVKSHMQTVCICSDRQL